MKLKVISEFFDKYTDELYSIGKEIEVDEKRGKEILSNPLSLVEKIEETKPKRTSIRKTATK
ncbi:hypothetical protein ACTNED_00820 [Absicoccus porci]|uniref:hypothetical protein n=1 Tax=Absicoccus porci TaxID=2486576 RepID=UPI003F895C85